jgi:hypothetical protein
VTELLLVGCVSNDIGGDGATNMEVCLHAGVGHSLVHQAALLKSPRYHAMDHQSHAVLPKLAEIVVDFAPHHQRWRRPIFEEVEKVRRQDELTRCKSVQQAILRKKSAESIYYVRGRNGMRKRIRRKTMVQPVRQHHQMMVMKHEDNPAPLESSTTNRPRASS